MTTAEMPSGSEEEEEEEEEEVVSDVEMSPHQRSGVNMESDDEEGDDAEEDDDMVPEEVVDDEEDEDEDEDAEDSAEPEPPPRPPTKTTKNTLQNFLKPKAVTGDKKKKGAVAPPAPPPPKPTAAPASKAAKGKGPKAVTEPAAPAKAAARGGNKYSPHSDSDDEQDEQDDDALSVHMTLPAKKQVPMPPDAIQEYEDQRVASAQAAPATASGAVDAPPTVHASAMETTIFLKNEKTNKWSVLSSAALLYAPEASEAIKTQLDKLTIPGRKDRTGRQTAMFDENATKMMSTVKIAKLQTDGTGSGTGPAMTSMLMLQSVDLTDAQTEIEFLTEKANELKAGAGPGGTVKHVDVCTMLDPDIAKRIYNVHKCPLPQVYNPNNNSSNKYKVPSKLEELAKTDGNFTFLGPAERAKRAGTKRASEATPSKADGKRPANGAAAAAASAADVPPPDQDGALPEHGEDTVSICGNPALMKVFASKDFATSYAELRCKADQRFTVCQAGPGKFILLLGPVTRS